MVELAEIHANMNLVPPPQPHVNSTERIVGRIRRRVTSLLINYCKDAINYPKHVMRWLFFILVTLKHATMAKYMISKESLGSKENLNSMKFKLLNSTVKKLQNKNM